MNFVLEDILDTEKKQLEGMWNIPEGATFWVPLTSAFYSKGDGGGYPDLPPIQDTRTTATEDPVDAMIKNWDVPNIEPILRSFENIVKVGYEFAGVGKGRQTRPVDKQYLPKGGEVYLPEILREFTRKPGKTGGKEEPGIFDAVPVKGFGRGPGDLESSFEKMITPVINVEVTVPEVKDIKVESYLTATLYMDGAKIASIVKQTLSRELDRVTSTKRYTVPGRAV